MKKTFLLCMALGVIFLLCACSFEQNDKSNFSSLDDEELIVVGFSQVGSESDWRIGNTQSMINAFSSENGYRLILDDAQQKHERQITAIRNFINQDVDYIVLAPTTEHGWDTVLNEAKAAGIPVILVDRKIEVSDDNLFTCWVGSDFRKEGDKAVAWMETHLPDTLRIVHLQGNIGSSAQIGRSESLNAALDRHPGWSIVFEAPGDFIRAKGQELTESLLKEGINFDVIYSENDNMTYGAIDALKAANIKPGKDVAIVSFDASSAALRLVMNGEINLDVECNPMHGPRVHSIIKQLQRGETPSKYTYVDEVYFEADSITDELIENRGY